MQRKEIASIIRQLDKIVGYKVPEKDRTDDYICAQLHISLSIDPEGNINPCNRLPIVLGNIKADRIRDVWEQSIKLKQLANTKWGNLSKCIPCPFLKYCVRCAGAALLEDNDLFGCSSLAYLIAEARYNVYEV